MGPVNWIVVLIAALAGGAFGFGWYRLVLPPRSSQRAVSPVAITLAMLASATMLGHNFARIGAAALTAKPWLFWMMSGGFALWFVVPALYVATTRHRASPREWVLESLGWLLAFAAMGTVFWVLGQG
jgi:hypothetical protein